MKRRRRPGRPGRAARCLAAFAAFTLSSAQSWAPPAGGAAEMFRQADRVFRVGARSGGAGGRVAGAAGVEEPAEAAGGRTMRVELVPVERWDDAAGPLAHGVDDGRVLFYRQGDYAPRFAADAGQAVPLPPGVWYVVGEAPGRVSTFSTSIRVAPGDGGEGDLVVPLVPACELGLSEGADWRGVDRVDLVALDEAAVFPLLAAERRRAWVPAGRYLAYAVHGDGVIGLAGVESCVAGESRDLTPPPAPSAGRQGLIVELPRAAKEGAQGTNLPASEVWAERTAGSAEATPAAACLRHQGRAVCFFPDLPAVPLRLRLEPSADLEAPEVVALLALPVAERRIRVVEWPAGTAAPLGDPPRVP